MLKHYLPGHLSIGWSTETKGLINCLNNITSITYTAYPKDCMNIYKVLLVFVWNQNGSVFELNKDLTKLEEKQLHQKILEQTKNKRDDEIGHIYRLEKNQNRRYKICSKPVDQLKCSEETAQFLAPRTASTVVRRKLKSTNATKITYATKQFKDARKK